VEDSPPPAPGRFRSSVKLGEPADAPFDWVAVEAHARDLNAPDLQWWDRIDAATEAGCIVSQALLYSSR